MYSFNIRTRQEEVRTYNQNHNLSSDTNAFAENGANTSNHPYSSFTLSTNVCIYVHGILMATLFVIGIVR